MGGNGWRVRHQLTHNQLMSPHGPQYSAHSTAKTNDKNQEEWHLDRFSILGENPSEEVDDDDENANYYYFLNSF